MKIIFAGTGQFGISSLQCLIEKRRDDIVCVISQPDRPKGRGLKPLPSPIKALALEHELKIYQPESINSPEAIDYLQSLAPELILVVAYGQKLSRAVLSIPRQGCFNLHASLLPKYRGAAPINYAILEGETQTGVTIFKMEEQMDTGAIINQRALEIGPEETASELAPRLSQLGAEVLEEALDLIERGGCKLKPQDESQVSYAPKLAKKDGLIKWSDPAQRIANRVRAMQPWPGAYTFWKKDKNKPAIKINITKGSPFNRPLEDSKPGRVINLGNGIEVATGSDSLIIRALQSAGHKVMPAQAFINGYRIKTGDHFVESE